MKLLLYRTASLLSLILYASSLNLCEESESSPESLAKYIHQHATPQGRVSAGIYTKIPSVDLGGCLAGCCSDPVCNVILYHGSVCYTIQCNASNADACKPVKQAGSKYRETFMVEVRKEEVAEEQEKASSSTINVTSQLLSSLGKLAVHSGDQSGGVDECSPGLGDSTTDCSENEDCLPDPTNVLFFTCQCSRGYVSDPNSPGCIREIDYPPKANAGSNAIISLPQNSISLYGNASTDDEGIVSYEWFKKSDGLAADMTGIQSPVLHLENLEIGDYTFTLKVTDSASQTDSADVHVFVKPDRDNRPPGLGCEFGLDELCQPNERCVALSSRSRAGHCQCIKGYLRDALTGWCETADDLSTLRDKRLTSLVPKSTLTDQQPHLAERKDNLESTSTLNPGPSTTPPVSTSTPSTATSTTAANLISGPPILSNVTTTTLKPAVVQLVVSAGENKVIQLPQNEITLSSFVLPADAKAEYKYQWSLLSQPKSEESAGQMVGISTNQLKVSKLTAGVYVFKLTVTADGKFGEGFVNVTVVPAFRENKPPVAIVKPASQVVNQPNDVVLDGSDSSDDDKVVKYLWERISGPLNTQNIDENELTKATLVLKGLSPGNYTFKLTVTDSEGAENSTMAMVYVIKEIDYPPKANAGSNVIISLPQNSISLYGNASTDDKGIVSYEWIKKSDKLTADMTGVRSPVLHLENLEIGDYTFTLKVTDSASQTDSTDVHVFVKPEHNKPPVANAGKDQTLFAPVSSVTLDGTASTDDQTIVTYHWAQVSGPSTVTMENADRAVATASKLAMGDYKFQLTVHDNEDLQSSAFVVVSVKENENHPPVAKAGGDKTFDMSAKLVTLDGSQSSDDKAIVSYEWTRDEKSLAFGDILNDAQHKPVLELINLLPGRYIFTLKVTDSEGLTSTDSATVYIKQDPYENDWVEIELDSQVDQFTQGVKKSFEGQLSLLLNKNGADGQVVLRTGSLSEDPRTGNLRIVFLAFDSVREKLNVIPGVEVAAILKKKKVPTATLR